MVKLFAECKINLMNINPAYHPEVNEILNFLLLRVQDILSDQFIGMYLFGSLANGDFDKYSDIDVLVVTNNDISGRVFSALQSMHMKIATLDHWYSNQLEVSYIPKEALRRYDPGYNQHPHLDRGKGERLQLMQHESDWVVQRYILYEHGIVLAGPEIKTLIDPVSTDDLRKATQSILFGWYAGFLNKSNPFGSRGYQSYTVLSLCRILYTLRQGDVVSKRIAAGWAKETLASRWKPLIERALSGRQAPDSDPPPQDIHETLDLIRYALEYSEQTEKERFIFGS